MGAPRHGIYDDAEIAGIIEKKRIADGITVAKAAELAGMGSAWSWYKKADGSTPFSVEEIGKFAAAVGAPRGWPFIEWSAAKWLAQEMRKP